MDISIIIPAYNRLWSLPETIESCRKNSCAVEIIVVDDGSTDGTWEWLCHQKDLIILKQLNWGKCWAVNNAFGLAKGKYIRFLDSDDQLIPGANDEQFKLAETEMSDIVVGGYLMADENNKVIKTQRWIMCDDFIAQQLGECDSSHYSAYLFKKSFINDIPHRPDYSLRDDRLLVLEAALKNPKLSIFNDFALLHKKHTQSRLQYTSGSTQIVQNYQHLNIYKKIFDQLSATGQLTQRRVRAAENVLWPLCHWIAKYNIDEANDALSWMTSFDPDFEIPEKGIVGLLYKKLGFKKTEKILSTRRTFMYG